MQTESQIFIQADVETVYRLAAAVERWPALLPHYRRVTIHRQDGPRRLVEMAAWRNFIPVSWWAEQELFPEVPRITFRHVRGITTGMAVQWRFDANDGAVTVSIHHALDLRWPLIGSAVAERIIGPLFVANIAGKTLRRIKQLAERAHSTAVQAGVGT